MTEYVPIMISVFTVLGAVISLLIKGHEAKKRNLEIEKLQKELSEKNKIIKPATLHEIEKYSPNYERIRNALKITV
jgi:hypothetical protein